MGFAGGRLSQITATGPRVSSSTVSFCSNPESGRGYGKKPCPAFAAEPPLRHEPPHDRRGGEVLPPPGFRALERRQHLVEPRLVGARERARQNARARHHADLDVLEAR